MMASASSSPRRAVLLSLVITVILICFMLGSLTEFIHFESSISPVFGHQQRILSQTSANQTSTLAMKSTSVENVPSNNLIITDQNQSETLGIAFQIMVLSLPRRTDRRKQMEILRATLGLRWTYVDAVESTSAVVESIITWVTIFRGGSTVIASGDMADADAFRWPRNINALSSSSQTLDLEGSDLWTLPPRTEHTKVQLETAPGVTGRSSAIPTASTEPLTCAHEDNVILPFTPDLPEYQLLTPAKIACWKSHLSVIRGIAERDGETLPTEEQDVSVILEDDVDMEWDIRERLAGIWTLLPAGWDMVFLGASAMNFEHLGLLHLLDLATLCWIRQQVIALILE
ncbi:hypothetical protein PILCRDRAFT_490312 [Piloderma croceum F 1598]|uniref:Glycosyltransferase family 25 protein n=1 Tax=Piloderma croceum (strain F 1598) TaxID=765440 RepID=A0A0C3B6C7_PILCF|nr:hypothetical protein PILCRDRAFT_490312 [Piloderma croceum F 1598]